MKVIDLDSGTQSDTQKGIISYGRRIRLHDVKDDIIYESDGPIWIGRENAYDNGYKTLKLNGRTVSRHHAVVLYFAGTYMLEDLNSTNGTVVNNTLYIDSKILTKPGAIVEIGSHKFTLLRPLEHEFTLT